MLVLQINSRIFKRKLQDNLAKVKALFIQELLYLLLMLLKRMMVIMVTLKYNTVKTAKKRPVLY